MKLTPEDISRVQNSFVTLALDFDPHATFFYEALFTRAPDLRPLFRDDLAGQGMKFMTTLQVIVEKLDEEEEITSQYGGLGKTHASIGIQKAHFGPMEEALMDTLRNALGGEFDAATEAAWRRAYAQVSENMIRRGEIPE